MLAELIFKDLAHKSEFSEIVIKVSFLEILKNIFCISTR